LSRVKNPVTRRHIAVQESSTSPPFRIVQMRTFFLAIAKSPNIRRSLQILTGLSIEGERLLQGSTAHAPGQRSETAPNRSILRCRTRSVVNVS
jgi:hypothetical protein